MWGEGGIHYLHLHMDCIDTRCGHLSAKCNIDHRHTSRSKSIISMVTVGSYRQMHVYTPYLWVTLSVVLFRWHSCVHVASIPVSHSLRQATRLRTLPILLSCLIIFMFSGPFLLWFARLLILFMFNGPVSFQALLYPSRV